MVKWDTIIGGLAGVILIVVFVGAGLLAEAHDESEQRAAVEFCARHGGDMRWTGGDVATCRDGAQVVP